MVSTLIASGIGCRGHFHMGSSLNSLKGDSTGHNMGDYYRA